MEKLLRDLEYFACLAAIKDSSYEYPKAELEDMWRDTMLNQFHDVLPGTTISMVVDDVLEIYQRRSGQAQRLIETALSALSSESKDTMVLDPLRLTRKEVIAVTSSAAPADSQQAAEGTESYAFLSSDSDGTGRLGPLPSTFTSPTATQSGERTVLSNPDFSIAFEDGRLVSLVDRQLDRELIVPGVRTTSGGLVLFEDYPLKYDAWDVEVYHLDSGREILFDEVKVVEHGPLRASLQATASFGKSKAVLKVSQNIC